MEKRLYEVLNGQDSNYFLPFFWQHGESEAVLKEELRKIHEAGIRAVCVESRPHPDFMGPGWWRDLDIIMDEAGRRGMKVWLLDDAHFPTGFANGAIRDRYPEKGKRYLTVRTVDADGGGNRSFLIDEWLNRFDWMHPDEQLKMDDELFAVVASRRLDNECGVDDALIDLTGLVSDGTLYWDMPEGSWRIFILIITRNWGGNPDYINIIDADSVKVLIDAVYEPHYKRYGHEFGNTFAGFFSDEPGFGNTKGFAFDEAIGRKRMPLPWSDELCLRLEQDIGPDFRRMLPCLWFTVGEQTWTMRYKYMNLVTELYSKNFGRQIGEWCASRNVEYIGHIIEDQNVHARLGCGAGHFFRALAGQHMSGIDIIGQQVLPRYVGYTDKADGLEQDSEFFHFGLAKLGSSLGHIDATKKGRTMCEIFGASGWASGLKLNKWLIDHALVRGVNHFVPHAFSPKEFPDPDCPPHFYARGHNPQYRYLSVLTRYANRLCHLLSGGVHVAPVAILYHAEAEWSGECMYFQRPAHVLADRQIDYDILPLDVFGKPGEYGTKIGDGKLRVNQENYRCLIVPYCERIVPEAAMGIRSAVAGGVEVILVDGTPSGFCNNPEPVCDLSGLLKGCTVVPLSGLAEKLLQKNIFDIRVIDPQPYLRYYHVRHDKTEVYMFFNEHPSKTISTAVQFPVLSPAYLYDAFANTVMPLDIRTDNGVSEWKLSLSAYESAVVLFGEVDTRLLAEPAAISFSHTQTVEDNWLISFATAESYPGFSEAEAGICLTDLSLPGQYPDFSGTVRYQTSFTCENETMHAILDLGEAYEVAQVWINSHEAGVRICPPYRFEIGHLLQKGENSLQIDVTNTLAHKLRDPFSSQMAIEPSGLLGPVKILSNAV